MSRSVVVLAVTAVALSGFALVVKSGTGAEESDTAVAPASLVEVEDLSERLTELEASQRRLEAENSTLRRELDALEARLDTETVGDGESTSSILEDPALAELLASYKQQKVARETVVRKRRTSAERLAEQAAGFGITVDAWRDERAKLDEIDTREERIRAMRAFIERYRGSDMAAEASFDLGVTFAWLTDHKADAEALYRSVIDDYPEALDDRGVPMTAHAQFRLAALLIDQGRIDEAEGLHATLKADHANVVHPLGSNTYVNMVEVLLRRAGNSD